MGGPTGTKGSNDKVCTAVISFCSSGSPTMCSRRSRDIQLNIRFDCSAAELLYFPNDGICVDSRAVPPDRCLTLSYAAPGYALLFSYRLDSRLDALRRLDTEAATGFATEVRTAAGEEGRVWRDHARSIGAAALTAGAIVMVRMGERRREAEDGVEGYGREVVARDKDAAGAHDRRPSWLPPIRGVLGSSMALAPIRHASTSSTSVAFFYRFHWPFPVTSFLLQRFF